MAFVGAALLRLSLSDAYLRYVRESMQPWLIAAGVALVLLALTTLLTAHAEDAADHEDETAEANGHPSPRSAWLLVVPLLAIFLVGPPALGVYASEHQTIAPQPLDAPAPLTGTGPAHLTVSDYVSRAVWTDAASLRNRTVVLTGFTVPSAQGGWDLSRLTITCCAADAYAATVHPVDDAHPFAPGTWVRVTGHWVPGGGARSDTAVPHIAVNDVTQVATPRQTYE